MHRNIGFSLTKATLGLFIILAAITSCKQEDEPNDPTTPTPANLTNLPFGGIGPTKILIRNQGSSSPDLLSLWLCGLPANGAGANDASDWTNPDGSWDYTKKPQVAGNVIWDGQFSWVLDGNGSRILTGNGLPSHPTRVFPIAP